MSLRDYLFHEEPGVTLYCGDARVIVPMLVCPNTSYCMEACDGRCGQRTAIITDPPYGMNYDTDGNRFTLGGRSLSPVHGDDAPFDPRPWLAFQWSVLWGFNHFPANLPGGGALVWIKRSDAAFGQFLSDAEVAWVKGRRGVYAYRDVRHAIAEKREHPTEKPVGLMSWSIVKSAAPADAVIVDPFAGSGTTLLAAKNLGRPVIGIEIEPRYCELAVKRLRQEVLPL